MCYEQMAKCCDSDFLVSYPRGTGFDSRLGHLSMSVVDTLLRAPLSLCSLPARLIQPTEQEIVKVATLVEAKVRAKIV